MRDGCGHGENRKSKPPKKQAGQARGRRIFNGVVKDVAAVAEKLGTSQGKIRSAVARGLLPYRRWGGRVVFLAAEVDAFIQKLPGVSLEEALENIKRKDSGRCGPDPTCDHPPTSVE